MKEIIKKDLFNSIDSLTNSLDKEYIFIGESSYKNILLSYKSNNPSKNISYIDKNEFIKNITFDYSDNTLIKYIIHNYNYDYLKSKELLKLLALIDIEESNKIVGINKEIRDVINIKKDLINKGLISKEYNELSLTHYNKENRNNIEIILFEINELDSEFLSLLNRLNIDISKRINFINLDSENINEVFKDKYLIFKNTIKEFHYLFSEIKRMIQKERIDPSKIVVYMKEVNPFYLRYFEELYAIKTNYKKEIPLLFNSVLTNFLEEIYSSGKIEKLPLLEENNGPKNDFILILNNVIEYFELDSIKDFNSAFLSLKEILNELTKKEEKENVETIKIITSYKYLNDDEYLFVLDFVHNSIYQENKDNKVISDISLEKLKLNTSYKNNLINRRKALYFCSFNNVKMFSRRKLHLDDTLFDSQFVNEFNLKGEEVPFNTNGLYTNKALEALKTSIFDEKNLNESKEILSYKKYDKSFKSFNFDKGESFSLSLISSYDSCPFKFYVDKYLKVDKSEYEFSAKIGTLFHEVIEKYFISRYQESIDKLYKEAYLKMEKDFDEKEKMILKYSILPKFIESVEKVLEDYKLDEIKSFEDEVILQIPYEVDGKISTINGRADLKINYNDGKYSIIDFKTGNVKNYKFADGDRTKIQLPLYAKSFMLKEEGESSLKEVIYQPILQNAVFGDPEINLSAFKAKFQNVSYAKKELKSEILDSTDRMVEGILRDISQNKFSLIQNSEGDDDSNTCTFCSYGDICYIDKIKRKKW